MLRLKVELKSVLVFFHIVCSWNSVSIFIRQWCNVTFPTGTPVCVPPPQTTYKGLGIFVVPRSKTAIFTIVLCHFFSLFYSAGQYYGLPFNSLFWAVKFIFVSFRRSKGRLKASRWKFLIGCPPQSPLKKWNRRIVHGNERSHFSHFKCHTCHDHLSYIFTVIIAISWCHNRSH
jgi:hypothetical protein